MGRLALESIRIADFSWFLSGPFATRFLADLGAEVIKLETGTRWGGQRTYGPWGRAEPSFQYGGGWFQLNNRNKMSLAVNLRTPKGVEICKRLIKASDVAIENFSAGVMKKFGLEYPVLREINPRLIMVSMAGMGQAGLEGIGYVFANQEALSTSFLENLGHLKAEAVLVDAPEDLRTDHLAQQM